MSNEMADKNKPGDYFNRPEKLGAWAGFAQFMWNTESKQFMGRTGGSWAKIFLFYLIFYAALAAFFEICWLLFATTLIEGRPKWELEQSIIGTNPGLGFRPMPPESNVESTLIWYEKNNPKNSEYWVNELEHFLKDFEPKDEADDKADPNAKVRRISCKKNYKLKTNETCKVELDSFTPCTKAKKFGYEEGRPCIFLKLNKIYNWNPEYYNEPADKMPGRLKKHIEDRKNLKMPLEVVWVSCEGENPADIENLGTGISYYSLSGEQGFLGSYFPFKNTKGYLQPLVAVQFTSIKPGVLINIECKAWAKNIHHDRQDRRGSVHFELMIDEKSSKST